MTTLDNEIRKSGHYSEVSKPNRCYPLIFVGAVFAVGRVSNLMFGVVQALFQGQAHSFTSYQLALLVEDECRRVILCGLCTNYSEILIPYFTPILSPIGLDSLHFLSYSHKSHLVSSAYSVNTAHCLICPRFT